ncbi:MAG: chemotaxis protein CheD [candidate division WOR-3 bacterium]
MTELKVGIGEVRVERGDVVLSAYGVGSCVVVVFYEKEKKVGGLAHILLPGGNEESLKTCGGAIKELLRRFEALGIKRENIVAKIAGGATMFKEFNHSSIGKRNVMETRALLGKLGIPIVGEDVLGERGRTVIFNLKNGEVRVRSYRRGEKII